MTAWFRSNTVNSRSIDNGSLSTPRSARPYIPSGDINGNVEAMMIDMLINEIQMHISRLEDEHVSFLLGLKDQQDLKNLNDKKLKSNPEM